MKRRSSSARPGAAPRHERARAPAHAAPLVREPHTAVLAGPARGAGDARPREHLHHAGLHAPRLPGARQGVRRSAPAGEEEMNSLVLKKGREKSLNRRHPWIFSGAVEKAGGKAGETVDVVDASKKFVARAAYSPKSQIRARVWTFDRAESVDVEFFRIRIQKALALREALPAAKHTNALRLVHGESDGLPGLVVDRYADVLVAQFLAAGVERWRDPILDLLVEITGCEAIFERSDAEVRKLEGLDPRFGFARGNRNATRCPIIEYGLNFRVDLEQGQKTGFFLDQRENRARVRSLAAAREVLDGFCYTGGFSIAALAGGAKRITAIESSRAALDVARENLAANPLDASRIEFMQGDVFGE